MVEIEILRLHILMEMQSIIILRKCDPRTEGLIVKAQLITACNFIKNTGVDRNYLIN